MSPGAVRDGEVNDPWERWWRRAAALAAAVFAVDAVLQSSHVPLLLLVAALALVGGAPFVRARPSSPQGRRQYAAGALTVAGAVLVAIGIGHHVTAGLATAVALAVVSPWPWRQLSDR